MTPNLTLFNFRNLAYFFGILFRVKNYPRIYSKNLRSSTVSNYTETEIRYRGFLRNFIQQYVSTSTYHYVYFSEILMAVAALPIKTLQIVCQPTRQS